MQTRIMSIFTRTPLHVGCGSSVGAVDQPVVRERHTGYPVIPGSSIKGVLADLWIGEDYKRTTEGKRLFGEDDNKKTAKSGSLAIGEAKLLAFPVRSARGCFALVTSPVCLERYARDAGISEAVPAVPAKKCLAAPDVVFEDKAVVLEEYRFDKAGEFPTAWAKILSSIQDDAVLNGSETRLVLLTDEDLAFFAQNSCQISQHVGIDPETGTAAQGKLYNQEEVPSESLFYTPVTSLRGDDDLKILSDKVKAEAFLQFGAKGTTGIGYCTVKISE